MGGETWALKGIDLYLAGTPAATPTLLVAGITPERKREWDGLERRVDKGHHQMVRLLNRFSLERVEVGQIRNLIAAARGTQRKALVRAAHQLGQLVQIHQEALEQRRELRAQLDEIAQDVDILIRDRLLPGVSVRVGPRQRIFRDELKAPRFYLRDDKLRWN
jgi:uncharacterized protein (DUF342 family)